jgi:hypothetical protein
MNIYYFLKNFQNSFLSMLKYGFLFGEGVHLPLNPEGLVNLTGVVKDLKNLEIGLSSLLVNKKDKYVGPNIKRL